jgi:hypothetical protein
LIGGAIPDVMPAVVATATAEIWPAPVLEGFHVQVTVNGPEVVVSFPIHPGIRIFRKLKVTFDA